MDNINLQIEHLKTSELIPYAYNARTHSETQIAQIISSIQEFGFVNPILLGDDNIIIAGHGRLAAALKIGMETVPVIRLSHLSETQRRALILADNKIAENAGWDEELLKQELSALDELDFDLSIAGFNEDEINNIADNLERYRYKKNRKYKLPISLLVEYLDLNYSATKSSKYTVKIMC